MLNFIIWGLQYNCNCMILAVERKPQNYTQKQTQRDCPRERDATLARMT